MTPVELNVTCISAVLSLMAKIWNACPLVGIFNEVLPSFPWTD